MDFKKSDIFHINLALVYVVEMITLYYYNILLSISLNLNVMQLILESYSRQNATNGYLIMRPARVFGKNSLDIVYMVWIYSDSFYCIMVVVVYHIFHERFLQPKFSFIYCHEIFFSDLSCCFDNTKLYTNLSQMEELSSCCRD